ncbi:MAG: helicase HerA-like domain-containing protein, partial [Bacteroidota bacterium]
IFFCTQSPSDIPSSVLGQLGMKFQHALRAFTARDRKTIKMVAENYPITDYYKVDQDLTQLGIGEAFITVLNEKGVPTPLVHTLLRGPASRMDVITDKEKDALLAGSELIKKYNKEIDRDSAYEMLNKKIDRAVEAQEREEAKKAKSKASSRTSSSRSKRSQKSTLEQIMSNTTTRQIARTVFRELTRGLLGILKK